MDYQYYAGKPRKPVPQLSTRMPVGEVQKTFKIFCGNLAGAATKEDLHYLFSQYGPVVEAVVMVGKFYGFVHMAYEEDGWKAICELRGYNLHGKAMAVEASINSKKAAPLYKQNIIGKGISALDDFGDYNTSKGKNFESREARPVQPFSQSKVPESFDGLQEPTTNNNLTESHELKREPFFPKPPEPRERYPEPRETRPEAFLSFSQTVSAAPLHSPSSLFSYPPSFCIEGNSQPSPIGHPPQHLSQVSPLTEFPTLKSFEASKDRGSPQLKMPSIDSNFNPQNSTADRLEQNPVLCPLCGAEFDEWQHKPKILSCGHTFCCDCLLALVRDSEVKCPVGCAYATPLTNIVTDPTLRLTPKTSYSEVSRILLRNSVLEPLKNERTSAELQTNEK
ncbi:hypothetical protein SK128_002315, partial [Halocaridina rubra]